ncbi:MAG: ABC transporter ATP-binding protein [Gammaproteobacteria bacterium]|jgi:putative ABC transport system ATP-binding protein|nr:macrolide ABC transporter ATP-binding protein [Chromatiales bacterium]MCP4926274.1 ABC transporter ATP-binding protein [Gammaproteobacteria bacterium]MDP7296834.1 ABC transporter ATP-binding protein [Gammaproteobacteria bacterium]MDP7418696.1 ABC transporter ATP-binding protein [Gammaproteobacteria bacterium]MDP7660193.1 ABC transporter ATP-binding protein [Gammaproteobacteria bacterium]
MIKLEGLCRDFQVGDQVVHALDHLDLVIRQREYVSIMGPSGSGKSTLLNILGLLDSPSAGNYWLDDISTASMQDDELASVRQKKIGFVFQSFHLVPRMNAVENIELPMVLAGLLPADRRDKVAAALERVGLTNRADHRPDQLSGGERQRVAIARAIVMQPMILLADEPTGNLDRQSGEEIVDLMENLNNQGLTLIVVTHDPAIGNRAQRKVRIEDGRIKIDIQ